MRISYSALDTYKKCPQKYKFQEIERRKAKKSKEAIFGTSVHEALKFMFSRDPLFPTLEEVLSHFRESFSETSVISEADKVRYIESGEKMIKSFYTKNPPWNFTVIDLESRFEVALDDPHTKENHLLVGKIDRIDKQGDKKYEIIDYKTSSKLPSQEKVDSDLQLSLYQLGLQKRWPHLTPEDIVLSLYFLKAGEKLTTSRSPHDLRRTEEKLLSDIRTIEKKMAENDFPPIPSPLCNWCSFKPICPAWRHLYEKFETPKESRPAEVLVQEYAKLKQEIAEREAALKKISREIHEYLNTSGLERLFGDAYIIARKIQERTSYDMTKLEEVLKKLNLWEEVLAPDAGRLKKILPGLPAEIQEELKEAILIKRFPVLAISKNSEKV